MIDTEKFIKIVAEGDKFLTSISHLHPMKIKGILEGVYEMYKGQFPAVLQDEYEKYRGFDITSGEVCLENTGIVVIYNPEIGSQKIIAELPLEIVKPYFNEILK